MSKNFMRGLLAWMALMLAACWLPVTPATAAQNSGCEPAFAPPAELSKRLSVVCGVHAPEDLEVLDRQHVIVSQTRGLDQQPGHLSVLDVRSNQISELPRKRDGGAQWGDAACLDQGAATEFSPHGIHLSRRSNGARQLLVVNHAGRETIEFYEVRKARRGFEAAWRGCVQNDGAGMFNDVAANPQGGFVATVMFDKTELLDAKGLPKPGALTSILSGRDTGYLLAWAPGQRLRKLANSEAPFNNGVQFSADGRQVYFAAWTGKQLRVYDLAVERVVQVTALDFLPDNLSLGRHGAVIVAGITDLAAWQDCAAKRIAFCSSGFNVAAWNPQSREIVRVFDGPPGLMAGASVGLQLGRTLYVGSYSGDRILRITLKHR